MSRISNLLAPRRRCLESTSSGRSIRTSRRVRIWFGSDSFCMSSGTASFHSGMRRIKSAMARHSWVRITVSVVPVIARRCSRREFLKFIRLIKNIKYVKVLINDWTNQNNNKLELLTKVTTNPPPKTKISFSLYM